ncbi:Ltp family lipoprotein [Pediococcus claussenii]|uniref:Prophage Lp1 protein 5 n=1 Tax=Pediococcus claussenii (strain ATCC BAA-344 / DSM 14800 / JCM 18046 / KCTC 3811 / LMG 21948 / P06) TaxID=701521 RepID=G8PD14_PEDCP|nr:Ltp family lipoprotein [Pediococcus claussenii]AEV95149.1 Prophage Lp1 protein 5 [Pediococcus claussenii ATCC BAA-344]ANZ70332.1 hypothetical protein AYR57_08385 [Pediococcus claussenii]ANZ72148.1 hypothetical protein AYR58_08385 [Pediococcus claussenii]KRN19668.1 hypothetical protein IV79_GL001386 [Pediococcus claussenii]
MKKTIALGLTLLSSLSLAACSSDLSTSSTDSSSTSKTEEKKLSVPTAYTSALNKARDYATTMDMSKQAVHDQLTSEAGEQFSSKAADYAMSHLTGVDWNKNALNKAKSYQKDQDMSPEAIRDQLTATAGEQFTASEADYAVTHLPK